MNRTCKLSSAAAPVPSIDTRQPVEPDVELAVQSRTRPSVLLALSAQGQPTASLLRAAAFARVLHADLHVVRVVPDTSRVNLLFPQRRVADAACTIEWMLLLNRTTRNWLHDSLPDDLRLSERFALVRGSFVEKVADYAAQFDAKLIVLPSEEVRLGSAVAALASTSGVPVLVARESSGTETIIAATDLAEEGYPILRKAAELRDQFSSPVVAIHNVNPARASVGGNLGWPVPPGRSVEAVREARTQKLTALSQCMFTEAEPVIREELDLVEAILSEARSHDANMIVVGTHRRSWAYRLVVGSVAARVVNRASSSVLVTPLDSP